MRKAIELGILNMISYFTLTFDIRAVAQANMTYAIFINVILSYLSFTIVKRVSSAKGFAERIAYIIGGVSGVIIGIIITQKLLGH